MDEIEQATEPITELKLLCAPVIATLRCASATDNGSIRLLAYSSFANFLGALLTFSTSKIDCGVAGSA